MPPKNKNTPNGFFMYMQEQQKKIKAETKVCPSMREMPALCRETWNNMSAAQRAHYDALAKKKKGMQGSDGEYRNCRMDNQRQIIADRKDPIKEDKKRRAREVQQAKKDWAGQDIRDITFYVIDFQVMYKDPSEDYRFPMEIGMVSFTLRDGITKYLHRLINPCDVPQGNRHLAIQHSESTHEIPLNFDHGDTNFVGLWSQIEHFLVNDPNTDEFPPIYCRYDSRDDVELSLEFIHATAAIGEPNRVHKVFCIEDLLASLITMSGKMAREPSMTQVADIIRQNRWDYTSSIRCFYHEEKDNAFCSLSIARRNCFAIFDNLSEILDFKLTSEHMPNEIETGFSVVHPATSWIGRENKNRSVEYSQFKGRSDGDGCDTLTVRTAVPSPPSPSQTRLGDGGLRVGPQLPKVNRVEIRLSDDDDDDDNYDDAEEDDVLHTEEVKSTSDLYHLKELRMPKTPSMFQESAMAQPTFAGQGHLGSADQLERSRRGRGRSLPMGRGYAPAPGGVSCPPTVPISSNIPPANSAPPPPGFSALPASALVQPSLFMRPPQATPGPASNIHSAWQSIPGPTSSLGGHPLVPRGRGVMGIDQSSTASGLRMGRGYAPR